MKVLFVSEGPNGCGLYRVELPLRYLSDYGVEGKLTHVNCSDNELRWADVVVVQKQTDMNFYTRLSRMKALGKRIVYELDDDVFNVPSWNPAYTFFQRVRPNLLKYLQLADAVTASTAFLGERLRKHNPNVYVLPNSLDFQELDREGPYPDIASPLDKQCKRLTWDQYKQRCEGRVVIGWAGSPTHKKDLQILVPVIKRLSRQYPGKVLFVMGGCVHRETATTTPYGSLVYMEMVPPRVYLRYTASLGWDIGLAPVADHLFNYSKSNLKVIEYMASGYVPVASDLVTYNTTIQHGKTGYLCKTPQDWMRTLRVLIENKSVREEVRNNAAPYVRQKFDIATNARMWADAYRSVR
jgi:glycosyltransferase involved in cell wall biosynthesis